jgi:cytochrome P450
LILRTDQIEDFEIGSARHGCVSPLLGDGIFTQDGPKWEFLRKLLAPLIQKSTLPDLGLIERHFQKLVTSIKMMSNAYEHCVDLKPILFDLSLALTTEFLLGESAVSSVEDKSLLPSLWADNLTKELNTAFKWIAKRERLKNFFWMIDSKGFRASCKAARELVDEIIARMFLAIEDENPSKESYVALKPLFREQVGRWLDQRSVLNSSPRGQGHVWKLTLLDSLFASTRTGFSLIIKG